MMHFSIPDVKEEKAVGSSSYVVYILHINGIFHCNVRYSLLHSLHEQLKRMYGSQALPSFPPKKFLPLSERQLTERQYLLERYLQEVAQDSELANGAVLKRFLLQAQQGYDTVWHGEGQVNVFLLNGNKIQINVLTGDNSEDILQRVCEQLRIPAEHVQYFSLFIQKLNEKNEYFLSHLLQNYESPLMTLKNFPAQSKIIIRKCCWDPALDLRLMSDHGSLNLLYTQTVSDVEKGWIEVDKNTEEQLATLQSRGAKREYLEIARTLKYYGYLSLGSCTCDYPEPGTEAILLIGHNSLILRCLSYNDKESSNDVHFKITRIRCWKITQLNEVINDIQISFEYLIAKDKLQWIAVISEHVFLVSVCLQSIVDELMLKKNDTFPGSKTRLETAEKYNRSQHVTSFNLIRKQLSRDKSNTSNSVMSFGSDKTKSTTPVLENDSFEKIVDEDL